MEAPMDSEITFSDPVSSVTFLPKVSNSELFRTSNSYRCSELSDSNIVSSSTKPLKITKINEKVYKNKSNMNVDRINIKLSIITKQNREQ